MTLNKATINTFYAHIKLPVNPNGCWEFDETQKQGYGIFRLKINGKETIRRAHRVAWAVFHGKWPTKLVCHKCDNRPCVRPDHLFQGTHKDNMQDASKKGKIARGERQGNSKLTSDKVREIRSLEGSYSQNDLGRMFGVSAGCIESVLGRHTWKHIHP